MSKNFDYVRWIDALIRKSVYFENTYVNEPSDHVKTPVWSKFLVNGCFLYETISAKWLYRLSRLALSGGTSRLFEHAQLYNESAARTN